jgi:tRNA (adenine57-N1/adenine58-N1)-methyltransferase catalytic subunit
MSEPLGMGEPVLLLDQKGRRYLIRLDPERSFQFHRGVVPHRDVIGLAEGSVVTSSGGGRLVVLRPRLADYILKMPRGAQVVYPKDIGQILVWADIRPGDVVLEAGTGSGALTCALLRAVGTGGRVVSVERRDDHAAHARRSITEFFGELPPQLELVIGEVEDEIARVGPDRLVLDVPEPWHAARRAGEGLVPGGVLCAYLPTVPQVQTTVEALEQGGGFVDTMAFETLFRTWSVSGRSVRPDHRMVGHTGFVVVARRLAVDRRDDPGG